MCISNDTVAQIHLGVARRVLRTPVLHEALRRTHPVRLPRIESSSKPRAPAKFARPHEVPSVIVDDTDGAVWRRRVHRPNQLFGFLDTVEIIVLASMLDLSLARQPSEQFIDPRDQLLLLSGEAQTMLPLLMAFTSSLAAGLVRASRAQSARWSSSHHTA